MTHSKSTGHSGAYDHISCLRKEKVDIVQPSRTHQRLEIYSAGTISTNQFGTKEAEALCIELYALSVINEGVCDVPPMRDGGKYVHYTV